MPTACRSSNQPTRESLPGAGDDALPLQSADAPSELRIENSLTIGEVGQLHGSLKSLLTDSAAPVVDLSAVTTVDALGLQLIVSARRSALALGKIFRVNGAGDVILAACAAAGISPGDLGVNRAACNS